MTILKAVKETVYLSAFASIVALAAANEVLPAGTTVDPVVFLAANAIFLASATLAMKGYQLAVTLICFGAGVMAIQVSGIDPRDWIAALNKGASVIALFAVIPAISIPIKSGGYLEAFEGAASWRGGKPWLLFPLLAAIHLMMSIILNIGSIPAMQKLLGKANLPRKYLSLVYQAGYSSYMVFSPFDGLIQLMIISAGTSYAAYFTHGLAMVILIVAICTLLLVTDRNLMEALRKTGTPVARPETGKVAGFILHIMAMIILTVATSRLLVLKNPALGIALVISGYSLFWTILIRMRGGTIASDIAGYGSSLLGYRTFLPFLISASFLGAMLAFTPLKGLIGSLIASFDSLPRYFIMQALMVTTACLSLCGIHMMITVTAMLFTITPAMMGLSPQGFALLCLTCWFIAMNASPLVPFSTVVADAIGESPVRVALRWNLRLSIVMIVAAPALLLWLG